MRVEILKEVAIPSPKREIIEAAKKSTSDEQRCTRPNRRSQKERRMYMEKTELSQPHFLMRRLDTKRAEKYPKLIELKLREDYQKMRPE